MVKLATVAAYIESLPDVVLGAKWNNPTWMVGARGFAWHRSLSKADLVRFGDVPPPTGDMLAVVTADLDAKEALLAIAPPGFFTIPHFNGYAAVLIELRKARMRDVKAAILDAYQTTAARPPPRPKPKRKPKPRRG